MSKKPIKKYTKKRFLKPEKINSSTKKLLPNPKKVERKIKPPKILPKVLQINEKSVKAAFIGRSNVGKSSLINYLLGHKIAKTSKHPGKTRKISLFRFNDYLNFADMPGYGYAVVAKARRYEWNENLLKFFFEDGLLRQVFVLIDSSISPMVIDKDFVSWLQENNIPHSIIFTKSDKAKQSDKTKTLNEWRIYLDTLEYQKKLELFEVSVKDKKGSGKLKDYLNTIKK
jgi:GTP-binding protein